MDHDEHATTSPATAGSDTPAADVEPELQDHPDGEPGPDDLELEVDGHDDVARDEAPVRGATYVPV